jgi:ABC-2 type transport system permease protein
MTVALSRPTLASIRRIRSIGRAELLLFWRNRTALFNAVLLPVTIVGLAASANIDDGGGLLGNAFLVTSLLGLVLLGVVYYTLVSTYVARREELVLKRLRVGELTDAEILAGTASPAVAIAVAQIVLLIVAGAVFLGLPMPVNAPVLALGALGGVGLFVLLAAASATFTRTVEMAQVTTLPILGACLVGSGLMLPLEVLPGPVAGVLRFLPLTPALELMRLGWLGTTGEGPPKDFVGVLGAAAVPVGILVAWVVVGILAVRRWFRWEPRQ